MPSPVRLGSFRSGPLLVALGLAGVATAVTVAQPSLQPAERLGWIDHRQPQEVIDQVWQIVYRDFLDSVAPIHRIAGNNCVVISGQVLFGHGRVL